MPQPHLTWHDAPGRGMRHTQSREAALSLNVTEAEVLSHVCHDRVKLRGALPVAALASVGMRNQFLSSSRAPTSTLRGASMGASLGCG